MLQLVRKSAVYNSNINIFIGVFFIIFMAIYRCAICKYEFDEDKTKKNFSDLKACPSCKAKKSNLKEAKDFLEEAVEQLSKYRAGTPKEEIVDEDD